MEIARPDITAKVKKNWTWSWTSGSLGCSLIANSKNYDHNK